MTADGTGLITAAFRRNLFIIAPKILISQILPLVLAVKCFSIQMFFQATGLFH
jgi:hypothetical protein